MHSRAQSDEQVSAGAKAITAEIASAHRARARDGIKGRPETAACRGRGGRRGQTCEPRFYPGTACVLCVRPWACWTGCIFSVSCVFARMHENAKVCPPGQRGMARPPWYGGSANRFSASGGGGRLSGSFRARQLAFLVSRLPGAGMISSGSEEAMDESLSSQARPAWVPELVKTTNRIPPNPICARKARQGSAPTNGCRNGISRAWRRRALMYSGTSMGKRLENALLTPSCPCVRLFQLV